MKASLKLGNNGNITLVITPESDVEAIALERWSDLKLESDDKSMLLIEDIVRDKYENKAEWAARQ